MRVLAIFLMGLMTAGLSAELGYQFPVPLLDVRRAIRTLRARAEEWRVDVDDTKLGERMKESGGRRRK